MALSNVQQILEVNRKRPFDEEAFARVIDSIRPNPDELAELLHELVLNCSEYKATGWLLSPVCGWLPLSRLDEVANEARAHLTAHEGCHSATGFLERYAMRHPSDIPPRASHLSFPREFMTERLDWRGFRAGHPTWVELAQQHPQARLGGVGGVCSRCGGVAERLLLLPASSASTILPLRSDVAFIWCAWCSPSAVATFSRLNEVGTTSMLVLDLVVDPGPLQEVNVTPETPVGLVDLGPEWYRQDWAWSNDVENLYRVGGEPTWIQNPEVPMCPDCGKSLAFVAQLDLGDIIDGEGLVYLFWCDRCSVSAVVYQCT
jgi:hypothetical protein